MSVLVPYVIEKSGREERAMDIYSRLLKDRIVILGSQINDRLPTASWPSCSSCSLRMASRISTFTSTRPAARSPRASPIYDTMQYITCDVATYCVGQAASMGAILLTAGAPGKRNALPNARIMIHQPLAGMEGTAADLAIHAKEVLRIKQRMNEILIKHTGQSLERIQADTDRDNFMLAEEAKAYGLIDNLLEKMPVIPKE